MKHACNTIDDASIVSDISNSGSDYECNLQYMYEDKFETYIVNQ